METIEDDYIVEMLMTTSHHYLMFFTNTGRVYRIKAYEIPEASRTSRGTAIINLIPLQPDEKITAMIPIKEYEDDKYLFMATRNGIVKKTPIKDYENIRKNGLAAINLREDDKLIEVKVTVLNMHDLRMVSGPTHTNVIFDIVLDQNCRISEEEIKSEIEKAIHEDYPNFFTVVDFDKNYIRL